MNPIVKALWITALLDGNSEQGTGKLTYQENDREKNCCMGVLCKLGELVGIITSEYDVANNRVIYWDARDDGNGYYSNFIPKAIKEWADLPYTVFLPGGDHIFETTAYLANMNDTEHKTFPEIAEWIAKNL